mgnify:FL=1
MPSEEMVFMKRTIFPFLIKVRPSLRDSAFSLRFPVEFPHGEIFYRKNAPKAQGRT